MPLLDELNLPTLAPVSADPFLVSAANLNNYDYIADAVDYWRTAGGALATSVPLAFEYALP